jgi:hypothetical protein
MIEKSNLKYKNYRMKNHKESIMRITNYAEENVVGNF